ncbi:hypothetical protein N7478_006715 [Penicillium angulare]|uniref:uncharacterized protein n=1 Tax=Penicillium angulare TaxID=116970 RepID=UPI002541815D|nr:uncharacterized protein N7478_006715 [Penicillium angulare]KAJ5281343.1 hypothetical protein N7478_006715 [Penicillium angulare]
MASYEMKDQTIQSSREVDDMSKSDRDDLQLQRLGKKPVLKALHAVSLSYRSYHPCSLSSAVLENVKLTIVPGHLHQVVNTTGWLTTIGWQAAFASASYMCGTEIQGVVILAWENYDPKAWHGTMIVWCSLLVAFGANMIGGKFLPRAESLILVVHILGFFGILIPLVYMSNHKSTNEVFTEFTNGGEFATDSLSWFVGMTGCVFSFAGGDAAVHMAEEVGNAATAIPHAILLSVVINGILGFAMLIAALFCMGSLEQVLSTKTGYPFIEIFYQGTGSVSGTVGMCSIILIIAVASGVGMLAATSRQFWSFARDKGVPGWRLWSQFSLVSIPRFHSDIEKVSSQSLPHYAIYLTMTISFLLALINIGSAVALNDVVSMAVSALYLSYLLVGSLLLYRRCRGDISLSNENDDMAINIPGAKLVWGPFRIPGIWGILVNGYAVIYSLIVIFFSFWPSTMHPEVSEMNYSVARHIYQGPVLETVL